MLKKYFKFEERRATWHGELFAALSTFFAMSYILIVNPMILGSAGMDHGAVFTATCLAAAMGCILMGVCTNYPLALAPSMGLNAYFSYTLVLQMHFTWQQSLAAVFFAGVLFLLLSGTRFRQWLINIIPFNLKIAIVCGIGLFIAMVALKNLNLVEMGTIIKFHFSTSVLNLKLLFCLMAFLLMLILSYFRVSGAILFSMLIMAYIGFYFHLSHWQGFFSMPPSLAPTLLHLQFNALGEAKFVWVTLIFLWVALFDNTGTLIAVLHQAKLLSGDNKIPRLGRALMIDSVTTMTGSLLGTSSTGCYIESSVGVSSGGRTGLMSVIIGILFLVSLYFAPLAESIPDYATSAALLYVAWLMIKNMRHLNWKDYSETIPAIIMIVAIPLFFSIADGVCIGLLSYVILKVVKKSEPRA